MTLPPLPTPKGADTFGADYTADQMRDYARAAIAAHVPEAAFGNIAAVPAQPLTDEQIHESLCEACSDGSGPVSLAEFRQDEAFADMVAFTRALERRIAAAPQAVPVPADMALTDDPWRKLYRRAINEANGLTNYVEDRPELRGAERRLAAIEAEARTLAATFEPTPEKKP